MLLYPEWREDKAFADCARQGAKWCIEQVAVENGNELEWDPSYGDEHSLPLALGKAGMMTEFLTGLIALGEEQYLTPLQKTIRFIYNRHKSGELGNFWRSSWMHFSVIAPVLRVAVEGIDVFDKIGENNGK